MSQFKEPEKATESMAAFYCEKGKNHVQEDRLI
jgi:hypothetical protein